jgi:hypothetical protein
LTFPPEELVETYYEYFSNYSSDFIATSSKSHAYGSAGGVLELSNNRVKVGVDPFTGCGIGLISDMKADPSYNFVNTWDFGRWIQASYYGEPDGSNWNGLPWLYNPVQVGSWQNFPATVLSCKKTSPTTIEGQVIPRNWASQHLTPESVVTLKVTLLADTVNVKVNLKYTGKQKHPIRNQEIPAAFFNRKLSSLVYYSGSKPWTRESVNYATPGGTSHPFRPRLTENWAGYVDPKNGKGVAVYSPKATFMTSYRVGPDTKYASSDCVYLAPLTNFSLQPNSVYSYEFYVAVGSVNEMRNTFYAYKAKMKY